MSGSNEIAVSQILESLKSGRSLSNDTEELNLDEVVKMASSISQQRRKSLEVRFQLPRKAQSDIHKDMGLQHEPRHNVCAILDTTIPEAQPYQQILAFLKRSRIVHAISARPIVYRDHIQEFWIHAEYDTSVELLPVIRSRVDNRVVEITTNTIRQVLQFNDSEADRIEFPLTLIKGCFSRMNYVGGFRDSQLRKTRLSHQWRYLMHILIVCMSPRKGGFDGCRTSIQSAMVALVLNKPYNFSKLIFQGMTENISARNTEKFLMYPRFIQLILNEQLGNLPTAGPVLKIQHMEKIIFSHTKGINKTIKPELHPIPTPLFGHLINPAYQEPPNDMWENADEAENVNVDHDGHVENVNEKNVDSHMEGMVETTDTDESEAIEIDNTTHESDDYNNVGLQPVRKSGRLKQMTWKKTRVSRLESSSKCKGRRNDDDDEDDDDDDFIPAKRRKRTIPVTIDASSQGTSFPTTSAAVTEPVEPSVFHSSLTPALAQFHTAETGEPSSRDGIFINLSLLRGVTGLSSTPATEVHTTPVSSDADLRGLVLSLQQKVTKLIYTVDVQKKTINARQRTIDAQQSTIDAQQKKIDRLTVRGLVLSLQHKVTKLSDIVDAQQKTIDAQQKTVDAQQKKIDTLTELVTSLLSSYDAQGEKSNGKEPETDKDGDDHTKQDKGMETSGAGNIEDMFGTGD